MANTSTPTSLMGLGLDPFLATNLGNHISTVTATGTTLGTAAPIVSTTGTALINGQSSQTGAAISTDMPVGAWLFIKGTGAVAPVIWMPTGTSINANSDNTTGLTMSAATASGFIFRASTTKFYSVPLAP